MKDVESLSARIDRFPRPVKSRIRLTKRKHIHALPRPSQISTTSKPFVLPRRRNKIKNPSWGVQAKPPHGYVNPSLSPRSKAIRPGGERADQEGAEASCREREVLLVSGQGPAAVWKILPDCEESAIGGLFQGRYSSAPGWRRGWNGRERGAAEERGP
ncbi:hypothetical protein KM043_003609 [Ampulex compressa]|nr:hypothetical protein KM043_003609 [Ampulex compressa]